MTENPSDPYGFPNPGTPGFDELLTRIGATAQPRRGGYQLGAVGAFVIVAACACLMAWPIGLASHAAWWLFMSGWGIIS